MPIEPLKVKRPGGKQDIERVALRSIVCGEGRLVIPLFQRRYCWTRIETLRWWSDVVKFAKVQREGDCTARGDDCTARGDVVPPTDQGLPDAHNINLIRIKISEATGDAVVVDGQQRLTTSSILLAAIWHQGQAIASQAAGLYPSWQPVEATIRGSIFHGSGLKLIPSLSDREAFAESIRLTDCDQLSDQQPQIAARKLFDANLRVFLKRENTDKGKLQLLDSLVTSQLDCMQPMLVKLNQDANLTQIFQWYQEKSLMGLSALLAGVPGVSFRAMDLVRNLVMSNFAEMEVEEQERIYQEVWVDRVERTGGVEDTEVEDSLQRFLSSRGYPVWPLVPSTGGEQQRLHGEQQRPLVKKERPGRKQHRFLEEQQRLERKQKMLGSEQQRQGGEQQKRYVSQFEYNVRQFRLKRMALRKEDQEEDSDWEEERTEDKIKEKDMNGIELYARFFSYITAFKQSGQIERRKEGEGEEKEKEKEEEEEEKEEKEKRKERELVTKFTKEFADFKLKN